MQTVKSLSQESLDQFIDYLFEIGPSKVWFEYSEYGQNLKEFHTAKEVLAAIRNRRNEILAIYFPKTKGSVKFRKIELNPKVCEGHKFRFQVTGWALFHLCFDFGKTPYIGCRISCNSQRRSEVWFSTIKDMGNPASWNWKEVETIGRAISRKMGKLAHRGQGLTSKTRKIRKSKNVKRKET